MLLLAFSCGEQSTPQNWTCIVESKYDCPAGYVLVVSDIKDITNCGRIKVGQYTYEHTSPGDTLVFNR